MKLYKLSYVLLGASLLTTACNDINEMEPEGSAQTTEQVQRTNEAVPSMTNATYANMYSILGTPCQIWTNRADDFSFIMMAISADFEGADFMMGDNDYDWFSICGEYSSRNANYANPYIRYVMPYRTVGAANDVIAMFPADTDVPDQIYMMAQAHVIRAFAYMNLAPYFAGNYQTNPNDRCIPILSEGTDYANNPRATVKEVWESIKADLDYAIEKLDGYVRPDKSKVNQQVAYALRARANLTMGNWDEAASDAEKAMEGYSPATAQEVSVPTFVSIDEHNWIWGILITQDMVLSGNASYCNASSWISAFSGDGYAAATVNTPCINKLLYDKIAATDVRKGWWLDADKHSPNWAAITWAGAAGDAIADLVLDDGSKDVFLPYTNIKFGQKSGIGNVLNNNDFPLVRVEEMILVRAEALARGGHEAEAKALLQAFVAGYRDIGYNVESTGRSLLDEIWFQRRVELWGEGFFVQDARRLGKNIVRTHGDGTTNWPDDWAFNVASDNPYLNMRFPQTEKDTNAGIVDNEGGRQPVASEAEGSWDLTDGVTD